MLKVVPLANALALIAAVFYVACAVVAALSPGLYAQIARTWVHGMDVSTMFPAGTTIDLGASLLGLVTFTAVAWLTGAAIAAVYSRQVPA
jgi:hypothetical protein